MFDAIRQQFNDYVQTLPNRIPEAAIESAVYSFVLSALFSSGNMQVSGMTAALAATVSIVSSLTLPFFRRTFADQRGNLTWYHFAATQVANLGITQLLVNSLTAYRVNLLASAVLTVIWSVYSNGSGCNSRSTHTSPNYVLV